MSTNQLPRSARGGARRVPKIEELVSLIELALQRLGGRGSLQEIRELVLSELKLPPEITAIRHKKEQPRSELDYRMAWARTKLRQQGRIERVDRGTWRLSHGLG